MTPEDTGAALEAKRTIASEEWEIPELDSSADEEAFRHNRYFFTTGLRAGEIAFIRNAHGEPLLSYRSFANIVGVIAGLVAGIVGLAGVGAFLLLLAEHAPIRALGALALTAVFTLLIIRLVPRSTVTLYEGTRPLVTIAQTSRIPSSAFIVTGGGQELGKLRRGAFGPLGRNHWQVLLDNRPFAEAFEESFGAALRRKFLGKFSRRFESDLKIQSGGISSGVIHRRPDGEGRVDYLELSDEALDPRLAVALATVILAGEP